MCASTSGKLLNYPSNPITARTSPLKASTSPTVCIIPVDQRRKSNELTIYSHSPNYPASVMACGIQREHTPSQRYNSANEPQTERLNTESQNTPLYQQLLGPAWADLAPAVQHAHRAGSQIDSIGSFDITHGPSRLARWLVHPLGLPPEGQNVPTHLHISSNNSQEHWSRSFGNFSLQTLQYLHSDRLLAECFGKLEFLFQLEVHAGGISFRQHRAAIRLGSLRLPLLSWLSPKIVAEEMPGTTEHQTCVHVTVRLPLLGMLIDYQGQMQSPEVPK